MKPGGGSVSWRFAVKFVTLYAVSLALLLVIEPTAACAAIREATAAATAWMLRLLDSGATTKGAVVISHTGDMEIIYECTVVFPLAVFICAVLAFPAGWRKRLKGLLYGSLALILLNQVRLISLIWLSGAMPDRFETAHLVVWPALLYMCVIAVWLYWVSRVLARARPAHEASGARDPATLPRPG